MIQSYLNQLYCSFHDEIEQSIPARGNEIYGELYYNSIVKLQKYLGLSKHDHFLDVGSGLGKVVFQIFLESDIASVNGIEINYNRYAVSHQIKELMVQQLPLIFRQNGSIDLIHGDFLQRKFDDITVLYLCANAFSFEFINAIVDKINEMPNVKKVVSSRKLPHLKHFLLNDKIFLHATWASTSCYIYCRNDTKHSPQDII